MCFGGCFCGFARCCRFDGWLSRLWVCDLITLFGDCWVCLELFCYDGDLGLWFWWVVFL